MFTVGEKIVYVVIMFLMCRPITTFDNHQNGLRHFDHLKQLFKQFMTLAFPKTNKRKALILP